MNAIRFCFGTDDSILTTAIYEVNWDKKEQVIEGFGVFAGREEPFYKSKLRNQILERLFSFEGLGLTILRGKIYSSFNTHTYSFPENDTEARAQLKLFKEINKQYHISKFVLSSWSPPYQWKTISGNPFGRVGSSINHLIEKYYQDFSDYIVNYISFCQKNGIDIYAVSAQNEPEFPTTLWEGCVWWPNNLAKFINNFLRPKLVQQNLDVKLMVGETGNWRTADFFLYLVRFFMKDPLKEIDILASHGYSLPMVSSKLLVTYETQPRSWFLNHNFNKPRWITEASCTLSYDGSMHTGIKLAVSLHNFLENNVSAYIYWLAMLDKYSNEALIFDINNELAFPKVYYVYGQFTKWIRPGFIRINLSKHILVYDTTNTLASFFINQKTNEFVLVVINPSHSKSSTLKLDLHNVKIKNDISLVGYETNETYDWNPMSSTDFVLGHNNTLLVLKNEKLSVKTITGHLIVDEKLIV